MRKCPQFLFKQFNSIYLKMKFWNWPFKYLSGSPLRSVKQHSPGSLLDLSSLPDPSHCRSQGLFPFPVQSPVLLQFSMEQDLALHFMFHILLNEFINTFSKNCHICYYLSQIYLIKQYENLQYPQNLKILSSSKNMVDPHHIKFIGFSNLIL